MERPPDRRRDGVIDRDAGFGLQPFDQGSPLQIGAENSNRIRPGPGNSANHLFKRIRGHIRERPIVPDLEMPLRGAFKAFLPEGPDNPLLNRSQVRRNEAEAPDTGAPEYLRERENR